MSDIAQALSMIAANMRRARKDADLSAHETQIIAVSKTHPAALVREALEAGQRVFGENRVQEAMSKWPELKQDYADIELHLIGGLQSNKAHDAVALFDVIQSVDRPKLAHALKKAMDDTGRTPRLFVQVNTGEEDQKGGVMPAELPALLDEMQKLGLQVEGLMCIPPVGEEPALHFALLKKLARRHGLSRLSMGMSGDYEIAAQMGADYVRVGTALFGARASAG